MSNRPQTLSGAMLQLRKSARDLRQAVIDAVMRPFSRAPEPSSVTSNDDGLTDESFRAAVDKFNDLANPNHE